MIVLGRDQTTNQPVTLSQEARSRGLYVIGSTGTGKTTLLQSIAYQDMKAGHGVCVIDPHGDMIDWIIAHIPQERVPDVILFDPSDHTYPIGLNPLDCDRNDQVQVRFVVSTILTTLQRLFWYSWGPRLEHVLHHTLRTTLKIKNSSLVELLLLLTSETYRGEKIGKERRKIKGSNNKEIFNPKYGARGYTGILDYDNDRLLINFWYDWFLRMPNRTEVVSSTVNKLSPFLLDPMMRNIIGQSENKLKLPNIIKNKKILLVNLSKGQLGENNSALLGTVLINLILIAALQRGEVSFKARAENPFHLIVDEYQNFASESFSLLQSEARKYGIDVVVAHQFRDQLSREVKGAALNVGNFVSFRTTGVDGQEMAMQFDNTPPDPEKMYVPNVMDVEHPQYPSAVRPDQFGFMRPMPQRMYSDVMMQTANELSNLPPFVARMRLIGRNSETGKPELQQFQAENIDPRSEEDGGVSDPLRTTAYGNINNVNMAHVRLQSRAIATHYKLVEDEIMRRTNHEIRPEFSYPPLYGFVKTNDE